MSKQIIQINIYLFQTDHTYKVKVIPQYILTHTNPNSTIHAVAKLAKSLLVASKENHCLVFPNN